MRVSRGASVPKCCFRCYMHEECGNRNECCPGCDFFSHNECLLAEEELVEEE